MGVGGESLPSRDWSPCGRMFCPSSFSLFVNCLSSICEGQQFPLVEASFALGFRHVQLNESRRKGVPKVIQGEPHWSFSFLPKGGLGAPDREWRMQCWKNGAALEMLRCFIQLPFYHTVQIVVNTHKFEILCFKEYPTCQVGARVIGGSLVRYINVSSPCHMPETNIISYVNCHWKINLKTFKILNYSYLKSLPLCSYIKADIPKPSYLLRITLALLNSNF